jgi:hypothetical protein
MCARAVTGRSETPCGPGADPRAPHARGSPGQRLEYLGQAVDASVDLSEQRKQRWHRRFEAYQLRDVGSHRGGAALHLDDRGLHPDELRMSPGKDERVVDQAVSVAGDRRQLVGV